MASLPSTLNVRLRNDLGEELHALSEPVLRRLRIEGTRFVALERDIAAVGAGLQDLGDVGRGVLVGDRRIDLVDEVLTDLLDLLLEGGVARAAPGGVGGDGNELLFRRILKVEGKRARSHG